MKNIERKVSCKHEFCIVVRETCNVLMKKHLDLKYVIVCIQDTRLY